MSLSLLDIRSLCHPWSIKTWEYLKPCMGTNTLIIHQRRWAHTCSSLTINLYLLTTASRLPNSSLSTTTNTRMGHRTASNALLVTTVIMRLWDNKTGTIVAAVISKTRTRQTSSLQRFIITAMKPIWPTTTCSMMNIMISPKNVSFSHLQQLHRRIIQTMTWWTSEDER